VGRAENSVALLLETHACDIVLLHQRIVAMGPLVLAAVLISKLKLHRDI